MIYVTKKCGKCKHKFVSRRSGYMPSMGKPFIKCPKCNTWQTDGEYKEYAMWKPIDYFKYFGYRVPTAICLAFLVSIIFLVIGQKLNLNENSVKYLCIWPAFIVFIIILKLIHSTFIREKEASNERLIKDKEYLELLYKSDLITEEKYKEFKDKK